MSIEAGMIQRYAPLFDGRLWWDETPDGMTADQRIAPFGVMEIVGGTNREYVDQSEPEWINARVQVYVWGARSIAVGDKMRQLTAAVRASNTADWVAEPLDGMTGAANQVLKIRGLRKDFSITYRNPEFQG